MDPLDWHGAVLAYADGSEELYDHNADPHEWTNLAQEAQHTETKRELAAWLPKVNVPEAPRQQAAGKGAGKAKNKKAKRQEK